MNWVSFYFFPQKFKTRSQLRWHHNFHVGFKPYTCADCTLTFPRAHHRKAHLAQANHRPGNFHWSCDCSDPTNHRPVTSFILLPLAGWILLFGTYFTLSILAGWMIILLRFSKGCIFLCLTPPPPGKNIIKKGGISNLIYTPGFSACLILFGSMTGSQTLELILLHPTIYLLF